MLNYVCQPLCRLCDDFHYITNRRGESLPCPACSCPNCLRLKFQHPDLGGCICGDEANEKAKAPKRLQPFEKGIT